MTTHAKTPLGLGRPKPTQRLVIAGDVLALLQRLLLVAVGHEQPESLSHCHGSRPIHRVGRLREGGRLALVIIDANLEEVYAPLELGPDLDMQVRTSSVSGP